MLSLKKTLEDTSRQTDWIGPAPWIVTPPPGPMARHTEAHACHHQMPAPTSEHPIVVSRAQGSIIEDVDGNRFLDFTAGHGTCLVGHCHHTLQAMIEAQSRCYLHALPAGGCDPVATELAERLCELAPGNGLKRTHLAASGEAALEAAVRLARHETGRSAVLVFKPARAIGKPTLIGCPLLRCLRGPLAPQLPYGDINAVNKLLETSIRPETVAAVLVEPMMTTCDDDNTPADFLTALRELCDAHRIMMIMDERRTGLGRTGAMWACDKADVQPDMLILGESLASGMPIGAVVMPASITEWPDDNGPATSAQPLSCAAGLATLELVEKQYATNAQMLSSVVQRKLESICQKQKRLHGPHGCGLMWTVEVVDSSKSRTPQPILRDRILAEAYQRGVLLQPCGPNAIRIQPPLSINRVQIEVGLDVFDEAVSTVSG